MLLLLCAGSPFLAPASPSPLVFLAPLCSALCFCFSSFFSLASLPLPPSPLLSSSENSSVFPLFPFSSSASFSSETLSVSLSSSSCSSPVPQLLPPPKSAKTVFVDSCLHDNHRSNWMNPTKPIRITSERFGNARWILPVLLCIALPFPKTFCTFHSHF